MRELEDRLRAEVVRRSQAFEPAPDLPARIEGRVHRHRRRRRFAAGALAVGVAAALVLVVAVMATEQSDEGSIRMEGEGNTRITTPPTTITTPDAGSIPGESRTGASVDRAEASTSPALGPVSSLNRSGIGPIVAGMTLREAQAAAGVTITPSQQASEGTCAEAVITFDGVDPTLEDLEIRLLVEVSGQDPMDGVVRAVVGMPDTEDGIMVGHTRAELVAAFGQPTRVVDQSSDYGPGAEVLVFEAAGYAYGAFVSDDLVIGLQSGDPAWVDSPDGCS